MDRLSIPVTIFEGINPNRVKESTLGQVLGAISALKPDAVKKSEKLREHKNNNISEYKKQKEQLSGFVIGKFSKRNKQSCKAYLPVLVYDLDGYENTLYAELDLKELKKCPYVFSAFLSPSGKGLRVLVWSNVTKENHTEAYNEFGKILSKHLNVPICRNAGDKKGIKEHIDIGRSSYANLWFIASVVSDDEFYLNEKSETFISNSQNLYEKSINKKSDTIPAKKYRVEFSEAEKVENLISQIESAGTDITAGVENWFKIGCALASEFEEGGRNYFHQVSKFHLDYKYGKCEAEYNRCLSKFSRDNITIGSFYHVCKNHNFQVDFKQLKSTNSISTNKLNRLRIPQKTTKLEHKNGFLIYQTPEFPPAKIDILEDSSLSVNNNSYWWTTYTRKGEKQTSQISNFIFTPYYHLKSTGEAKRIVSIKNEAKEEAILCLPQKTIVSANEINAAIEGEGNFIPDWNRKQFNEIKRYIYEKERRASEITILGYQPDHNFYVFSNGIFCKNTFVKVNRFGIAEVNGQFYYVPAKSEINKDRKTQFRNELQFHCEIGTIQFEEWSSLFCKVYEHNDNGIIGLCFIIATVFRDIIFDVTGYFPILFLFGPPQTGKTTFRDSLQRLFGEPQSAVSLGGASSSKGFLRKLGQFRNGLVVFEEFKNQIKDKLVEMMKNLYDGIGYERAQMTNDNKTHTSGVHSAVIAGGQQLPVKENALLSRVHILNFDSTKKGDTTNYERLKTIEKEGIGGVLLEILHQRTHLEKNFKETFNRIKKEIQSNPKLRSFSERSIGNITCFLATLKLLETKLNFPFSYDEAQEVFINQLLAQNEILDRTNEINRFWQYFDLAISKKEILSHEYKCDKAKKLIYVRLKSVYNKYFKHYREQGIDVLDAESLRRYLIASPAYIAPKGGRKDHSVNIRGIKVRAFAFDYSELNFESEEFQTIGSEIELQT